MPVCLLHGKDAVCGQVKPLKGTDWIPPFLFLLILVLGVADAASAQNGGTPLSRGHALPSPTAVAVRTEEAIVVDGEFDEPAWSLAVPVTEFIQRDPQEHAPATERTEVRILFDALHIYLGIICYDSNPAGIVATELRRDGDMEGDDIFEIMFDTFHDHRNGYRFRVNALGTMRDESVNNEGQIRNANWDEKWDAKARITEDGWVAEIAIPFKAMRFASGNGALWGVNFHRTIMRKNEDVFWSAHNRGYTFTKISGSGHLEGLSEIEGFRFRVKPFVTGSASRSPASGDGSAHYRGKIGIEDAKYLITPRLTLDLTVNPDFAQTDVDQAQVNLTRFSLFFPEKREFFQEGSGTFQFGGAGGFGGGDLLLFHSRRIGLSDNREEIPILGGLKLTGKQGPLEIGLLNMQTDREDREPGRNFTVLRLKQNVLARSSVGVLFTRNTGSPLGGSNRALGFDSNFTFVRYLNFQGFVAKTFSNDADRQDWAGKGKISWNSDRYGFNVEHLRIDQNFRPEMGFVSRAEPGWKGVEQTLSEVQFMPRPDWSWLRQFVFSAGTGYVANREGLLESREAEVGLTTNFESGDNVMMEFSRNLERLVRPFRIRGGGGTVPAGDYRFNEFWTRYQAFRGRRIGGSLRFERGGFFDGTLTSFDISPEARPNAKLSFAPSFEWNRISRRNSTFITREVNTQVTYSLSQKWLTRTTVVLNSQDKQVLVNLRLNYIFHPGDDLFVVYSESRNYGEASGLLDRALIVKLTYSLDR